MAWEIYTKEFRIGGYTHKSSYSSAITSAMIETGITNGSFTFPANTIPEQNGSEFFHSTTDNPSFNATTTCPFNEGLFGFAFNYSAGLGFKYSTYNYGGSAGDKGYAYAFIFVNESLHEMAYGSMGMRDFTSSKTVGCTANTFNQSLRQELYTLIKAGEIPEPTSSTLYIGDANGICRNVPKLYYGDPNGIARKCKLFYGDPNGIARLIIGEGGEPQPTILSTVIDYDFSVSNVDRITGFTPTGNCSYDSANGWLNLTGNWTFLSQENIPMNIPANASKLVLEAEIDLGGRTRGTDNITFRIGEGASGRTISLGENTWVHGHGNYNIYDNNKNKGFFNMRCVLAFLSPGDNKNYLYIDNTLVDTTAYGWSMASTLNHMLAQNFSSSSYGTWKIKKYKLYYI